jgi:hypothetical protein
MFSFSKIYFSINFFNMNQTKIFFKKFNKLRVLYSLVNYSETCYYAIFD